MKSPFVFTSVRQKLFAGVLLTSLMALLVSCAGLFIYDLRTYREASMASLASEAQLLGHVSSAALQFEDRTLAAQNLSFLKSRPRVRVAAIYDAKGELFASYVRPDVSRGEIPAMPASELTLVDGGRTAVSRPAIANGEVVGNVYLAEDLALGERVGSYAAIAFAVMLAALVVSALLSEWLQRGLSRPIIDLSGLARNVVETRDYSLRATRRTEDEIGRLVDAFNEMLAEIQRRTADLEASNAEVGRLNKDLERRVGERTAQLEESNLQLKAANLAKSSFLSMMSHEIRTPMNGVLGMLELMSLGELDPQQRTTLGIVRDSGRSLLRIIDDILDFSKIEAGKLEVRAEPASVKKIVSNVVGIYSGNASSKALVLESHVDPRISPAVMVDPLRLQQILNNLVSNAIKFTSSGIVRIAADLLEQRDGKDVVRFSVTDTGIGIPAEQQASLFQPFAQADGITRMFGGTGLGLSIGQRLASLMSGSLAIESEVGKGTVVSLVLPLPTADARLLGEPPDERRDVGTTSGPFRKAPDVKQAEKEGTLVLVVDDHPINRMLLMRQVNVLGYAAEAANDGREALEMWKSGRFRLVVTDCNMPEMDGYALARAIRAGEGQDAKRRTIVMACTANALKGEAENCFAAGMDDYIAKPVELEKLREKLAMWLPLPLRRAAARKAHDAEAPAPLLDREILEALSGGNAEAEREIFFQFQSANAADVAALTAALDSADMPAIRHVAHRIKGASNALGALALAAVCERIEESAAANDWSRVALDEEAFHREVRRLEFHLESLGHPVTGE